MVKIEISCSMCGKETAIHLPSPGGINLESKLAEALMLAKGWVFQQNREHLDAYCSKRCVA